MRGQGSVLAHPVHALRVGRRRALRPIVWGAASAKAGRNSPVRGHDYFVREALSQLQSLGKSSQVSIRVFEAPQTAALTLEEMTRCFTNVLQYIVHTTLCIHFPRLTLPRQESYRPEEARTELRRDEYTTSGTRLAHGQNSGSSSSRGGSLLRKRGQRLAWQSSVCILTIRNHGNIVPHELEDFLGR